MRMMMTPQPAQKYLWLFWLLAIIGLILDQTSKYAIFGALYEGAGRTGRYSLIPNAFRLTAEFSSEPVPDDGLHTLRSLSGDHMPRVNHGALFGFWGPDEQGNHGNTFFTVVSLAAGIAIIFWITCTSAATDRILCGALGLILAGTMGNLYDRLIFNGVRDFLHWYYVVDWPVFNLADCCLVCGAGLLLVHALFWHQAHVDQPQIQTSAEAKANLPEVVDVK